MSNTSLSNVIEELIAFRDARNWHQFHTPRQLAAAITIEAGELQQTMLWKKDSEVETEIINTDLKQIISDEIADVLSFTLLLTHELGLDPIEIIHKKIQKNEIRYPIEKSKGNFTKYNKL